METTKMVTRRYYFAAVTLSISIVLFITFAPAAFAGGVVIVNAHPTSSSTYAVEIGVSTPTPSTLHVFVEEYPPGSGCGGNVHQTNGGADFQVQPGGVRLHVSVPRFGGGYAHGFVKIGARLDNGPPIYYEPYCFRF
jgi:hypothetical protein